MGIVFVRTVIVFFTLLALMRMMGKRQIGEMQPYELVITLIISELACIPMGDPSIPLVYGITAIVSIYFLHQLVCLLDLHFQPAKAIVRGAPSIVINKNGIDDSQLKKNNLDVADLIESLRVAGYFSLDAVDYAIYESQGSFSALPKADSENSQDSLPILLVDGGKFDEKNLRLTQRDRAYYMQEFKKRGCRELKKILAFTVDGNGKAYLQEKGKKYEVFNLDWDKRLW